MVYRITRLGALILALVSMAGAGCVAQEAAKTLTVGAITVSYPAGMETQAKKVGETMKDGFWKNHHSHSRCPYFLFAAYL